MENNNSIFCRNYISNYKCSDPGLFFPIVNEFTWSIGGRVVVYLLGLIWAFFGAAIISDILMCSVETITSKTRKVKVKTPDNEKGFEEMVVPVWNVTVANLSLRSFGACAIEIMLAMILFDTDAGELSPSIICGVSTFKFLVITAVSVVAIRSPDIRRINHISLFAVSSIFAIFAFVWLVLILKVLSPNLLEMWEAILTLFFFPIFIVIGYITDRCVKKKVKNDGDIKLQNANEVEQAPSINPGKYCNNDVLPSTADYRHFYSVDKHLKNLTQINMYFLDAGESNARMTEHKMREFMKVVTIRVQFLNSRFVFVPHVKIFLIIELSMW